MDDLELLRRYVEDGCPRSFEAIVRRHIDWVYWSCMRQIGGGDHEVAEDVTQIRFRPFGAKSRAPAEGHEPLRMALQHDAIHVPHGQTRPASAASPRGGRSDFSAAG